MGEDSILNSIKKLLGISEEYNHFDTDLIIHINSAFSTLKQLGIGPKAGFFIKDATSVWSEFVPDGSFENVKTYVYLKVKMVFDPPSSSFALDSIKNMISEYEWRLVVQSDELKKDEGQSGDDDLDDPDQPDYPDPDDPSKPPYAGEYYDGSYSVVPKSYDQVLDVDERVMREDLTVEEIPFQKVSNESSGFTAIIGDD